MFLDFLRPGVRSGFECLRGRRHARPSVPTTGTNTPETLNGGCGGSVAFLLVLIVQSKPNKDVCFFERTLSSRKGGGSGGGFKATYGRLLDALLSGFNSDSHTGAALAVRAIRFSECRKGHIDVQAATV